MGIWAKIEDHVKIDAEVGIMWPQTTNSWIHQKLEEARKDSPLRAFLGSSVLVTPGFWTPSLQNYGRINPYCFKAGKQQQQ